MREAVTHRAAVDPDVQLPSVPARRLRSVGVRLAIAVGALVLTILPVYLDRGGYKDSTGVPLNFVACLCYATVTLSNTGYGDIVPVTDETRLVTALIITPLRVIFLIVLVGTTVDVLAESTRAQWRQRRWRRRMRDHTVIIGCGTKGRSAALVLIDNGTPAEHCRDRRGAHRAQARQRARLGRRTRRRHPHPGAREG